MESVFRLAQVTENECVMPARVYDECQRGSTVFQVFRQDTPQAIEKIGAGDGARTRDVQLGKLSLD